MLLSLSLTKIKDKGDALAFARATLLVLETLHRKDHPF
jgi:hypothetical protein